MNAPGKYVDDWTWVHALTGVGLGLLRVPWWATLGAGVLYELAEQLFERTEYGRRVFQTSGPEGWTNAVTDVVVMMAGWGLGTGAAYVGGYAP